MPFGVGDAFPGSRGEPPTGEDVAPKRNLKKRLSEVGGGADADALRERSRGEQGQGSEELHEDDRGCECETWSKETFILEPFMQKSFGNVQETYER